MKMIVLYIVYIFFGLGFDKVAELLIEKGADVNVVGQGGHTALNWAAYGGNPCLSNQISSLFFNENQRIDGICSQV